MCGRYTVAVDAEALARFMNAEVDDNLVLPVYNASPGQVLPVILDVEPGRIAPAVWGFRRDGAGRAARFLINARSETVERRRAFRESFQRRRCLVVADGFYEWRAGGEGKQPYRIGLRTGEPFAFAGVWEHRDNAARFVILTTAANARIRPIHDRMPVILDAPERRAWLDSQAGLQRIRELLAPYPGDAMEAYPVSRAVNSSRNNDPSLIHRLDDAVGRTRPLDWGPSPRRPDLP